MPNKTPIFIDLFAGCGGMSLGLEQAGFQPVYVNELNNDALESYLLNRESKYPYLRDLKFHSNDISELSSARSLNKLKQNLSSYLGFDDIDLICGGPPCQGYSGRGVRRSFEVNKEDLPSNFLYLEMIKVIKTLSPKIFLFENVRGLLSSRWTKHGKKGEVFEDVFSSFNDIKGYEVKWDMLYSKDYGVPQNRPRVFIIGIKSDLAKISNSLSIKAVEEEFLPKGNIKPPNIEEILSDLIDKNFDYGGSTEAYPHNILHDEQRYFRKRPNGKIAKKGDAITEHEYSNHSLRIQNKFQSIIKSKGIINKEYKTKKFYQKLLPKAWDSKGPSITIASMPDDFIHYSQARTPTVREYARLQTFPDWYLFSGKRTTGGRRRAGDLDQKLHDRDLPKFTQIGNAVPPKLAYQIGLHIKNRILK